MSRYILSLGEVGAGDAATAGGKGTSLGALAAHGFPVPPGFVVTADACRDYFASLNLGRELAAADPVHDSERLQRLVLEGAIEPALEAAIRQAHRALEAARPDGIQCAVRSSATAEDSAGASFAGQHGTYYYVTAASLMAMIRRCWASLWSREAIAYRASRGVRHDTVFMAVVVQELIRSEVSGVAFTAHPVTGDRGAIVIESSWGMGAALVDGRVTPDRHVLAREGLSPRERRIADKRYMVAAQPADSDQRLCEVPADLRTRETLSGGQVEEVAAWALRCEAHFGVPQDVEWAFAGGRFHLLQSRPITTLAQTPIGEGVAGQWVLFKPVAENFTDPLSPLMIDLLARAFEPGLKAIGGRLYQNLALVRPLLPFRLSDEELAAAVYSMFAARPARLRLSPVRAPLVAVAGALFGLVAAVPLARTRAMPDDFMRGYRDLCRRVDADAGLGPRDTLERLTLNVRLFAPIGLLPVLVNVSSLRFAGWIAALRALLQRWAPALPPDAAARLAAGSEGVLSAEMGRGIEALAREAARAPAVADLILSTPPDQAMARLKAEPAARPLLAALEGFLAAHGHRALREFELMAPRWDENPAPILGVIRNHLRSEPAAARRDDRAAAARDRAEAEVRQAVQALPLEPALGLRRRAILWTAGRARYFLKLRENSRFHHIMAIASTRKKVLAIEADLIGRGVLKCRDDIFFLRMREIEALQANRLGWRDVEDRIRDRRIEHVRLSKMTPPKAIGVYLAAGAAGAAPHEVDRLQGEPASPGLHVGIARVILDPTVDATLQPGEVLVAPYTDPAWTPLFLVAGAAVVEVGSYLSHAGTVAREYGMACVVDVPDCTSRIRTGTRVEVDGNRGTVRILGEAT